MSIKKEIKVLLEKAQCSTTLADKIKEYEKACPMDLDLYWMKAEMLLLCGDGEEAYSIIKEGIRKNPYNMEMNTTARRVCKETKRYVEAVRYNAILTMLSSFFPQNVKADSQSEELLEQLAGESADMQSGGYQKELEYLNKHLGTAFGLLDHTYYSEGFHLIGTIYEDIYGNQKYNAYYDSIGLESLIPDIAQKHMSWWVTKLECLEVSKINTFTLGSESEYLLPVLQENLDALYGILSQDGRKAICQNKKAHHFEYYRLPPAAVLVSQKPLYIGNPIALKQEPNNKKLVLNIFVDGLSQKVIEEEKLSSLMPYTDAFFSKGVHCTNVYTNGEWTLPSIATYVTGVSSPNHMLIHNTVTNTLPADITVLAEYFKEQGYQTAKIDGDWRTTQSYGYGRGMDRIIYQNLSIGMTPERVVADVLEHLELMKETNQFVWMEIGDLHDIADGFSQKPSAQVKIPFEKRSVEEQNATSVKQNYSENKRAAYIEQMKWIDGHLAALYRYIEEHYKDDEVVISMFGDHGQGYLVKPDEHFLAEGRSKVGMLFRGGFEQGTVCNELISTCDYLPILCKLANIPLKGEEIDGRLPVFFGGEEEREYAVTDSIHPGDPYQAAIISKDSVFYFTSGGLVGYDGRFELGNYTCKVLERSGRECTDERKKQKYWKVLMQHIGGLVVYESDI